MVFVLEERPSTAPDPDPKTVMELVTRSSEDVLNNVLEALASAPFLLTAAFAAGALFGAATIGMVCNGIESYKLNNVMSRGESKGYNAGWNRAKAVFSQKK